MSGIKLDDIPLRESFACFQIILKVNNSFLMSLLKTYEDCSTESRLEATKIFYSTNLKGVSINIKVKW